MNHTQNEVEYKGLTQFPQSNQDTEPIFDTERAQMQKY